MATGFRRGPESAILKPICWVKGHSIYHGSGATWSHTKFQCKRCGERLDRDEWEPKIEAMEANAQ